MTGPIRTRRGCSPWAWLGCGCGMLSMTGLLLIFFILGVLTLRERTDPRWNMKAYNGCVNNLRSLEGALAIYRRDHHDALPARLSELEQHYISSTALLRCPLAERGVKTWEYRYTPQAKASDAPLITCRNHAHGPVILLHNGRVRVPEDGIRLFFPQDRKAMQPSPGESTDN